MDVQWNPLEWDQCGDLFLSNENLRIPLTFSLHQICMFMEDLFFFSNNTF